MHLIPFRWSLGNHENFALQIADATNFYITEKVWYLFFFISFKLAAAKQEKNGPRAHANLFSHVWISPQNRNDIKNGSILRLTTSPVSFWWCGTRECVMIFKRKGVFSWNFMGQLCHLLPRQYQTAVQLHERIQSSSMDAKLEALKDLANASRDITFAQEFINLDGISLLTQMVESGTEWVCHPSASFAQSMQWFSSSLVLLSVITETLRLS